MNKEKINSGGLEMQKARYKNQGKRKRNILIAILVMMIVIFIILITALGSLKAKKQEQEEAIEAEIFSSIADVLKAHNCRLIRTKASLEDGFTTDIYCEFAYDLYHDENSNETFFTNLIEDMAKFLNYSNFRMLDEKSKKEPIEICVIGDGKRVKNSIINGREDYFIYMDSRFSLSQYKEMETTEFSIQAEELQDCVSNGWSTDTNFGTRETIFQKYDWYFDEGIQIRKISGKIYNIIFTKNYVKPVVNGFTVGEKYDIIIRELGNPTFQNEEKSIIGYKSKEMYVFFEKDQISVYRNTKEDGFDAFFELVDGFLDDEYDLLEFMNELTYLWPDYEEYTYHAETVFLSYPNKGIDIKMNYENTNGIILYNNIGVDQKKVTSYLEHTEFIAQLQVDNVFLAEQRRVSKEANWFKQCEAYKIKQEAEDSRNRGEKYNYYMELSENDQILGVYFIAQTQDAPNCELKEMIKSYVWMNDECFLYSVENKGIYYYDLKNQNKGEIFTGEGEFEIKSYENGILKYDDKELEVVY